MQFLPPVAPYRGTRSIDSFGGGGFNAPRSKSCEDKSPVCPACKGTGRVHYLHKGVDFLATPGDSIVAPFASEFLRTGWAYSEAAGLRSLWLDGTDEWHDFKVKLLYVAPVAVQSGQRFREGEEVGRAQDVAAYHSTSKRKMLNHVHLELFLHGKLVDPTAFIRAAQPIA